MTSINFTYSESDDPTVWFIYDREGTVMAEATNEFNANLIVECLNGVSE